MVPSSVMVMLSPAISLSCFVLSMRSCASAVRYAAKLWCSCNAVFALFKEFCTSCARSAFGMPPSGLVYLLFITSKDGILLSAFSSSVNSLELSTSVSEYRFSVTFSVMQGVYITLLSAPIICISQGNTPFSATVWLVIVYSILPSSTTQLLYKTAPLGFFALKMTVVSLGTKNGALPS